MPLGFKPLLGTDESAVDDKGRVLVAKKRRERLGPNFAIAFNTTGCLCAYPQGRWERTVAEMLNYDPMNLGRERFTRLILSTADDEMNFDAQGRVVIPAELRRMGGIEGRVLLLGAGDRLEIWAKDEYEKFQKDEEDYRRERREKIERAYFAMTDRL